MKYHCVSLFLLVIAIVPQVAMLLFGELKEELTVISLKCLLELFLRFKFS